MQPLGKPARTELPGVGANLQDRRQIAAVCRVRGARTLDTLVHSAWGRVRIGLQHLLTRRGPMSMAPSQLGVFTRSRPDRAWPDVEFHVQPLSLDAFGEPLHRFDALTASVCNLHPTSRGTVRIHSPRWEDAPAIAPNHLSTPEDRQVAADSLRLVWRIIAQPAVARYRPEEIRPGSQGQTDEELARLAGNIATTIFHPVGTTAMGPDSDPMAVTDSHLRVRDGRGGRMAGLRVVDAGIMPTITSGNTDSPTLMIEAARWIAAGVEAGRTETTGETVRRGRVLRAARVNPGWRRRVGCLEWFYLHRGARSAGRQGLEETTRQLGTPASCRRCHECTVAAQARAASRLPAMRSAAWKTCRLAANAVAAIRCSTRSAGKSAPAAGRRSLRTRTPPSGCASARATTRR